MSLHLSKQAKVHNHLSHRTKWQPMSLCPDHWWGVSDSDSEMVHPSCSITTLTGHYIAKNRKTEQRSQHSKILGLQYFYNFSSLSKKELSLPCHTFTLSIFLHLSILPSLLLLHHAPLTLTPTLCCTTCNITEVREIVCRNGTKCC